MIVQVAPNEKARTAARQHDACSAPHSPVAALASPGQTAHATLLTLASTPLSSQVPMLPGNVPSVLPRHWPVVKEVGDESLDPTRPRTASSRGRAFVAQSIATRHRLPGGNGCVPPLVTSVYRPLGGASAALRQRPVPPEGEHQRNRSPVARRPSRLRPGTAGGMIPRCGT